MAALIIYTDNSEWLPIVEKLWPQMHDAPVFYSASMLELLGKVQSRKVALAVLNNAAKEPLVALPIFADGKVQNAHYNGWDNLGLITAKTAIDRDRQQFWEALSVRFSPIQLESLASCESIHIKAARVDSLIDERRKCPYIALGNSWDELNEKLGKKLVRNIRQYGNKAAKLGITFRVAPAAAFAPEELSEKLQKAFSFHETRMEDINQKSVFTPTQEQVYHQKVLQNVKNTFVIEAQNEAGDTVAFYYGLYNQHRLAWFNGGYDTQYYKYSIGTLLVAELISWAYENGQQIFDFLRGNETYKQRWTSDFDRNCTVYMGNKKWSNRLKLRKLYVADNRQRVGSKNALKKLINKQSN